MVAPIHVSVFLSWMISIYNALLHIDLPLLLLDAISVKLGRLSVGSAKLARSGIDDLLSSTEGGKHDYDW